MRCGTPLANTCTFKGGLLGETCKKENEHRAAYCTVCGSPTLYQKAGLLESPGYAMLPQEDEAAEELKLFEHPFFKERPLRGYRRWD